MRQTVPHSNLKRLLCARSPCDNARLLRRAGRRDLGEIDRPMTSATPSNGCAMNTGDGFQVCCKETYGQRITFYGRHFRPA